MRGLLQKISERLFTDPDQRRALVLAVKTVFMVGAVVGLLFFLAPIAFDLARQSVSSPGGLTFWGAMLIALCVSLVGYIFMLLIEGEDVLGNYKRAIQGFSLFVVILSALLAWFF